MLGMSSLAHTGFSHGSPAGNGRGGGNVGNKSLQRLYTQCIVECMSTSLTLLGILQQQPNYGYELKKMYDKLFGQRKPLAYGQVYSTLSRLERDGQAAEVADDAPSGGPERVKYEITAKGTQDLQAWLQAPEEPTAELQATMYVKTVLALLMDGEAPKYLDAQRAKHIQRMRELTRQRRTSNLSDKLLIDHALFHIDADLRWIDLTASRLTQLKQEVAR